MSQSLLPLRERVRVRGKEVLLMKHRNHIHSNKISVIIIIAVCLVAAAGCAGIERQGRPAAVPEVRPGILQGYLPAEALPNSLDLLPPPPAAGSAAFALDEEVSRKTLSLHNSPRWLLADSDSDLGFPHAAGTFSCALNAPVTEEDTPRLYMLLRRTLTDAGRSTYAAKNHYRRTRPFVLNKGPICPADGKMKAWLEKDGSYPSGHTTTGWAWALILSEISPGEANAILERGRAFGESRNVCNAHWHSDVVQGYLIGAATVAVLHADLAFRADLEAAKAELGAIRAKGLKPTRDCKAEAGALGR